MYMRLLYYANGARYKAAGGEWVFRKWFTIPSKELMTIMGVSRPTMYKIRDELAKAGYIRYKAGIGAGRTEYMLCGINGAETPQEAPKTPTAKPKETATQGSFDTDDFFAAAVRKSLGGDP